MTNSRPQITRSKAANITARKSITLGLLLALAAASGPQAQSVGTIAPFPLHQFLDANANPVASGKVCAYLAGTTTPTNLFTDAALSTPHAVPITLNADGRPPSPIYLDPTISYKLELRTAAATNCSTGSVLWVVDNIRPTGSSWHQIPVVLNSVSTGAQNAFAVGTYTTVVRWAGSSAVTFNGWAGGTDGRRVLFHNISNQTAQFTDLSGSAAAANQFNTLSNAGQWIGSGGAAWIWYDGVGQKWQVDLLDPGLPILVAFSAGNFNGSGAMTWTVASGDQTTFRYQQRGKTVTIWFSIEATTVGGTPSTDLQITIPGGFVCTIQMVNPIFASDNAVAQAGYAQINTSGTVIRCLRITQSNWTASTDATSVSGQIALEVN